MTLNFPTSPTNGQEFSASNGVIYTYNSADDSWTGETVISKNAQPTLEEISATPDFDSGTGTSEDPWIITPVTVELGQSARSAQHLYITGQTPGQLVFFYNSTTPPSVTPKFNQYTGVIDTNGNWEGYLNYNDAEGMTTTTGGTYVGKLNIGSAYFSWTVTQSA